MLQSPHHATHIFSVTCFMPHRNLTARYVSTALRNVKISIQGFFYVQRGNENKNRCDGNAPYGYPKQSLCIKNVVTLDKRRLPKLL